MNRLLLSALCLISCLSACESALIYPQTNFTATGSRGRVSISNQSQYCDEFLWDFGNGRTSTERNPKDVIFPFDGNYTIRLVAQGATGKSTKEQTVNVQSSLFRVFPVINRDPTLTELIVKIGGEEYGRVKGLHAYALPEFNDKDAVGRLNVYLFRDRAYTFELTDIQGKRLMSGTLPAANAPLPHYVVWPK